MNTRSVEILKKLCGGKNYQVEDLAHDFEISIRMIRYVIDDINDFFSLKRHKNEALKKLYHPL